MRKTIDELCALPGISGREMTVCDYVKAHLQDAPAVREIRTDRLGNCFVSLAGRQKAKKTVVFAAHMDEVGGMVTGITEDGYLRFTTVGGISDDVVFGKTVWVNGHAGVIGGKAVHQCQGDEKKTVPSADTLYVDIGAATAEEARAVAREGDAITFSPTVTELTETAFCAKALDDRVGCALLLALAHTVPAHDVTLIFTVQEEVGTRGAAVAAFATQPDIAIVIDATTASDIPSVSAEKQVARVGGGPVVSFMDKGTMYDPALYSLIRSLAEQNGILSQTKTMVAGGNDSRAFQCAGVGARVAAVSLPCRYIHSPSCLLEQSDVEQTYRLLELLLNRLPSGEDAV